MQYFLSLEKAISPVYSSFTKLCQVFQDILISIGILKKLIYVYKKPCSVFENCVNPVNQFSTYSRSYYFETFNRQTHYISQLSRCSFISFTPVIYICHTNPAHLFRFIVFHFIWSKFKWHTFFISLFISSFLVCRSAIGFFVFLYPANILNSLISCRIQKKNSLVFSPQKIMLSANKDNSILLSRPIDFNVTKYNNQLRWLKIPLWHISYFK